MYVQVNVRLLSCIIFPKHANSIFSWDPLTKGLIFLGPGLVCK